VKCPQCVSSVFMFMSYTPAFQGIDIRAECSPSAREKLPMRDAVIVLVRLSDPIEARRSIVGVSSGVGRP
jgi:hypothetical protein